MSLEIFRSSGFLPQPTAKPRTTTSTNENNWDVLFIRSTPEMLRVRASPHLYSLDASRLSCRCKCGEQGVKLLVRSLAPAACRLYPGRLALGLDLMLAEDTTIARDGQL